MIVEIYKYNENEVINLIVDTLDRKYFTDSGLRNNVNPDIAFQIADILVTIDETVEFGRPPERMLEIIHEYLLSLDKEIRRLPKKRRESVRKLMRKLKGILS